MRDETCPVSTGSTTCRGEHGDGEAPLAAGSCWKAVLSSHLRGGRAAGRLRLQSGERLEEGRAHVSNPLRDSRASTNVEISSMKLTA